MLSQLLLAATKAPKDGEGVKSGPIGLAVILVLCVAVYFLMKSMSKHLRKVREEFPADPAAPAAGGAAQPADPAQPSAAVPVEVPATDGPPKPDPA
jgi:hypothetical protein